MKGLRLEERQFLFLQRNFYQHLHHSALNAALKGMNDVASRRVTSHNNFNNQRLLK
ncbi:hypothetical protein [Budvicia diplopodorum]|uniref:hypothetical protein n=1 Tax=Budvicia diplopodorum TaxID=1119056 RepID=UPI001358B000|nr:hypothetical protein [Budvicia diplopodorum]